MEVVFRSMTQMRSSTRGSILFGQLALVSLGSLNRFFISEWPNKKISDAIRRLRLPRCRHTLAPDAKPSTPIAIFISLIFFLALWRVSIRPEKSSEERSVFATSTAAEFATKTGWCRVLLCRKMKAIRRFW